MNEHHINFVVSDVKMPIIFYTRHGSQELKKQAAELGASGLITKPNYLTLELAVKKALLH
jgi:FixJ family two-component response regulator